MKTKKWGLIILMLLAIGVLIWYLFLKNYNYRISFKTTQSPGAIYASLVDWQKSREIATDSFKLISKSPFSSVTHVLKTADSSFNLHWEINRVNNNESQVIVYSRDNKNSLRQNISVPFTNNDFVNRSIKEVKLFMEYVKILEDRFAVRIEGEDSVEVPAEYYAYLPLKSRISEKAGLMRDNIGVIMGFIRKYNIELTGDPFIMINNIDTETDEIEYEFCFPIKKSSNYPDSSVVLFKERQSFSAIKAEFNGNYRSTEFAWYELIDFAEKNNISFENKILEIYKNDPQSGTDSKDWIAEVYLPIK